MQQPNLSEFSIRSKITLPIITEIVAVGSLEVLCSCDERWCKSLGTGAR
jgi:hypothetical protein